MYNNYNSFDILEVESSFKYIKAYIKAMIDNKTENKIFALLVVPIIVSTVLIFIELLAPNVSLHLIEKIINANKQIDWSQFNIDKEIIDT